MRRQWIKFGDSKGQAPGHKENGVVMIAEPVNFDKFGEEEVRIPFFLHNKYFCKPCNKVTIISHEGRMHA